jgi:hypothetical protein
VRRPTTTARPGVFHPSGAVTCCDCTDSTRRRTPADSGEDIAVCDDCGARIWVRDDVAGCQRAMYLINDDDAPFAAAVSQTGGMCCATTIIQSTPTRDDGGESYYLFVTPGETEDESPFVVGGYFTDGAAHGGYEEGYDHLLMEGVDDARLVDACREMFKRLALAMIIADLPKIVCAYQSAIIRDVVAGIVPADVEDFVELSAYTETDEYGDSHPALVAAYALHQKWMDTPEEQTTAKPEYDLWYDIKNDASDAVDEWIQSGGIVQNVFVREYLAKQANVHAGLGRESAEVRRLHPFSDATAVVAWIRRHDPDSIFTTDPDACEEGSDVTTLDEAWAMIAHYTHVAHK